ncbi:hypothetical protein KI387_011064, partial [Taxus chinensis]
TAALSRVAVTGPPPYLGGAITRPPPRQGSGFVTEDQKAKKRGGKEKAKHAGANRGMWDVNTYLERFSGSRTPYEETCIIIGARVTLFQR